LLEWPGPWQDSLTLTPTLSLTGIGWEDSPLAARLDRAVTELSERVLEWRRVTHGHMRALEASAACPALLG
jgi:hypothetical protein